MTAIKKPSSPTRRRPLVEMGTTTAAMVISPARETTPVKAG
ncbi:hypothetical protein ABZV14_33505 [Streptosporangium canum]